MISNINIIIYNILYIVNCRFRQPAKNTKEKTC